MTDNALGLYLHIPFCAKKCAYCDFYSRVPDKNGIVGYTAALIKEIEKWGGELKNRPIDTIYIGGGTPSLLKSEVVPLLDACKKAFCIRDDAEITAEVNPESAEDFLIFAKQAGVNRISFGVQSGNDHFLKALGRLHTAKKSAEAVEYARKLGFCNISVDLMTALPESDESTLKADLDFILSLGAEHISAYILKCEEGTALYKSGAVLPDDDAAARQYLLTCETLEKAGYSHYEISNFAKEGFESRHNLKYWQTKEYLGIGASAHSYIGGRRFYYPRDLKGFLSSPQTVFEGVGGTAEEKLMLALRLKEGANLEDYYGEIPKEIKEKLPLFEKAGYITRNGGRVSLTDSGMLVSNAIITELIL